MRRSTRMSVVEESTEIRPRPFMVQRKPDEIKDSLSLLQYSSYNDYLDNLVTPEDICYLQNYEAARGLAGLGYKCTGETLSESKFKKIRDQQWEIIHPKKRPYQLASEDYFEIHKKSADRQVAIERLKEESEKTTWQSLKPSVFNEKDPLLYELAVRERANKMGVLATIIFIRDFNKAGHEVSGYIDYRERLLSEKWEPYFSGLKRIMPRKSDLVYYNWKNETATSESSKNFRVIFDPVLGLIFQHRFDKKTISPAPTLNIPGCNTLRIFITGSSFTQVALYDHVVRKKL